MPESSKRNVAVIFIKNSTGQFFLHQRLPTKKQFPNLFGIGAGGKIENGETPEQGAKREFLEETGMDLPMRYLFTMDFDLPDFSQTSHLFLVETDGDVPLDERECQWGGWMTSIEIDELIAQNKLCTDTTALYKKYIKDILQ